MIGPVLIIAAALTLVAAVLLLRGDGLGWRVGRLLSAAPQHTLQEAALLAEGREPRYIRIHGRVDSDEEFSGDDDKPLVFRRRRLQRSDGRGGWSTFDDMRLAVPFRLTERDTLVTIDADALGDGLVVVPRYSEGVASDLPPDVSDRPLPAMPGDAPVRLRVDQVSSVDHATAAGVPRPGPGGMPMLTSGMGRPLILTTLAVDEAMRVLGTERRRRIQAATILLIATPILLVAGILATVMGS